MSKEKNPKIGGRFNVDDAIRILDDVSAAKVKMAFNAAKDAKSSGRINIDDVEIKDHYQVTLLSYNQAYNVFLS